MTLLSTTKSLLHFTGSDGSVVFTDETGKTWTGLNLAEISTTKYKFPPTSLQLRLFLESYISTPDHTDFDFGSGDFTIELFVFMEEVAINQYQAILGKSTNYGVFASFDFYVYVLGFVDHYELNSVFSTGSSQVQLNSNSLTYLGSSDLVHLCFMRSGNTIYQFVNGVLAVSSAFTGVINHTSAPLKIGQFQSTGVFVPGHGYFDDFRVSKAAMYSPSGFTPPNRPLEFDEVSKRIMMFAGE